MRCERLLILVVCFVVASHFTERSAVAQLATGQSGAAKIHGGPAKHSALGWDDAENRWRSQPVDLSSQVDLVPPGLRQTRNAYWSHMLAEPLEMERSGLHLQMAEGLPMRLDPVPDPQGTLVVAKFEGNTVVPVDQDDLVMYTEMHFRIERVIQQPKRTTLSPGAVIDIDIIGGSIKMPSGKLKSFDVSPRRYSVQPGNTYLMMLRYVDETSSYSPGLFWKVENGRLTSGYNPRSPYIGQTVDGTASRLKYINQE